MSDVMIFKFNSGEEVVATLHSEDIHGNYQVSKPMVVQIVPQNGQMGLMLIPWVLGNQNIKVVINKNSLSVNHPISPDIAFEKQYLQQVSGITLLDKGKIQI